MNCRDFDQTWNRLLDAESGTRRDDGPGAAGPRLARESALREHAESCPSCRIRHRQFETLRTAMRAWSARPRPEPAAAPDAVDRIVLAASPPDAPARRARPLAWASGLAAAAVAASFFRAPPRDEPAPEPAPARRASLSVAMSDAREASLRLALTASEPAARLGLAMLDASIAADAALDTAPPPAEAEAGGPDASDLATRVGGYAAAGARPISDAARRAFGFLRTPSLDKTAPTSSPRGT